jgi:translation initiation factor IF-2
MKKIRINELARELEVKPGVILDLLPEFGVSEKKTHSSSIDEDVAISVRHRLVGEGAVGSGHSDVAQAYVEAEEETAHAKETMNETSVAVAEPESEQQSDSRPAGTAETPAPPARTAPIQPPFHAPERPSAPGPEQDKQEKNDEVVKAATPVPPPAPEAERPKPFQPLRPPIHPPLAQAASQPTPGQAASRNVAIPARPIAPPVRPGLAPTGPRQPLPPDTPRSAPSLPQRPPARPTLPQQPVISQRPAAPAQPAPPAPPAAAAPGTPAPPPAQASHPIPPTHVVLPGPPSAPPAMPGAPVPRPAAPARPAAPQPGAARPANLTPGAPIAPRPPQGARLVGQPAARPVVPPRPDVLARLQQQQQPRAPMPGAPRPTPPRPTSPTPGQPIFRGPIRPGQPQSRVTPGMPSPGQPARRPGQRPMHPTTPLRPESAQPIPTEQRRHQGKPGGRPRVRDREIEEGVLRERAPKRAPVYEPPPIDREITVSEGITLKELSEKLGVKANLVIKKLVEKKIFATINQTLDVKLAEEIAREFGASTNKVSFEEESTQDFEQAEEPTDIVRRAPIVTVMGHVDHGKTSLLDAIRQARVADREAGGITQHIGAYHVEKDGRKIVFIDTPGHQAFTRMRARGAKVTDIVVLVVAADDGVMPQTLEAIDHARAAGVPIIVAVNKIDKPDAQPDRVKQQLADRGLLAEDWGGDTVMVPVSAKAKQNLDLLLEMILLVADIQDLKASPSRPAIGTVLEAKLDRGRGPVATILVRNGMLRVGDYFICGSTFSKVRAMFDDRGGPAKEAEPSMPVEVIGFEDLPEVGDTFQVVTDTAKAKQIVTYREAKAREAAMAKGARVATLDSLAQQFKEGDLKDLNIIIKADVGGTAEVLADSLQQLSNNEVRVRVLHAGVGAITESDVLLASTSQALIIGFNVKPERNTQSIADQQKVEIRLHSIIYELIDEVKLAMTGLLDPVFKETIQGHVEVRETFKISKIGVVAGCYVADGLVRANSEVRVIRDGSVIHKGKIEALKRFKNDVSEVKAGIECGISIVNYNNIQVGDVLEAYMMERVLPSLQLTN